MSESRVLWYVDGLIKHWGQATVRHHAARHKLDHSMTAATRKEMDTTALITAEQDKYFGRDLEAMSFTVNYHRWILDEFREFIGSRIVEVGAGTGNFTALLLSTGPSDYIALEPAANVFALLAQRFCSEPTVRTLQGTLAALDNTAAGSFDTLIYVNVLEHIEDDREELKRTYEILARGGHLCIFVPALRWLYGTADRAFGHFRRYSSRVLQERVREAGFNVIKHHYFDLPGIVPWFLLFRVMKRACFTARQAETYDRLIVPSLRALESTVRPPLGKNLLLVARKD